jgi:hypothetical protein
MRDKRGGGFIFNRHSPGMIAKGGLTGAQRRGEVHPRIKAQLRRMAPFCLSFRAHGKATRRRDSTQKTQMSTNEPK